MLKNTRYDVLVKLPADFLKLIYVMYFSLCCRLRLFQTFESFRVIVAGGDGSIGWVLNEIDQLGLQKEAS